MGKESWVVVFRCNLCSAAYVMETIAFYSDDITTQAVISEYKQKNKDTIHVFHNCAGSNDQMMGLANFAGIVEEKKWIADAARIEAMKQEFSTNRKKLQDKLGG